MTDTPPPQPPSQAPPPPQLPEPKIRRHRRGVPSAMWIVPLLAAIAGGVLALRTYLKQGPTLEITFETADGLEAGRSDVRYKNVPVGKVDKVELTDDHQHIIATVTLTKGAAALAASDSKFWVERPRIGIGGVSGLGTLISGAYIGVDVGTSTQNASEFIGLEKPPGVTRDQRGKRFKLVAADAGSLGPRSPVYLRRVAVGQVSDMGLAADGKRVDLEVFVQAPYDQDVTDGTVFWNASGLDVALDATGLKVDTQSLATVFAGGVAFGPRDPAAPGAPAKDGAQYTLFDDRAHALAKPDGLRIAAHLQFHESVRGVIAGTPVELDGIRLGVIDEVKPIYDDHAHALAYDITASVFPERLGAAWTTMLAASDSKSAVGVLQALVGRGLRAQIRSGNLITGAEYVALAWFPHAKPVPVVEEPDAWVIPTERGTAAQLQQQVQDIVGKIDRIPFDAIGENVSSATEAARTLLTDVDKGVLPDAHKMLAEAQIAMGALREGLTALRDNVAAPDSAIQQSTKTTLEEVERAAYSLRSLSDYIEHHPESLLRGRAKGDEPRSP